MKLEKNTIKAIENSDAFFVIGIKNGTHFTAIDGSMELENMMVSLSEGMLGVVEHVIKGEGINGLPLVALIKAANEKFPEINEM